LDDVLAGRLPHSAPEQSAAAAAALPVNGSVDALSEEELVSLLNRELGPVEEQEMV
jgi:hypothetical protein